jgi:hypothetical protein
MGPPARPDSYEAPAPALFPGEAESLLQDDTRLCEVEMILGGDVFLLKEVGVTLSLRPRAGKKFRRPLRFARSLAVSGGKE